MASCYLTAGHPVCDSLRRWNRKKKTIMLPFESPPSSTLYITTRPLTRFQFLPLSYAGEGPFFIIITFFVFLLFNTTTFVTRPINHIMDARTVKGLHRGYNTPHQRRELFHSLALSARDGHGKNMRIRWEAPEYIYVYVCTTWKPLVFLSHMHDPYQMQIPLYIPRLALLLGTLFCCFFFSTFYIRGFMRNYH